MKKVLCLFSILLLCACTKNNDIVLEEGTTNYEGTIVEEDIHITKDGTTLENVIVENDLYVDASVEDGHVELINVEVKGTLYVYGGGVETVLIQDGKIYQLIGYVDGRVLAQDETVIDEVIVKEPGMILENNETAEDAFSNVSIEIDEPTSEDEPVVLDGIFDEVKVQEGSYVEVKEQTRINYMPLVLCSREECPENYKTRVRVEENATIKEMEMNNEEDCEIENNGNIEKVNYKNQEETNNQKEELPITRSDLSVNNSNGDYELIFDCQEKGTIHYVIQPYFNTTETPTVEEILTGKGLQNDSVKSQICMPDDDICNLVVSVKSIKVESANSTIKATGYMGDNKGQKPDFSQMDGEIIFYSLVWFVFEYEDGTYEEIGKIEYK